MITDRRAFQRFHILIVVECSVFPEPAAPFFGIARDVSYGGFSFETQFSEVHPEDTLEITIKHPLDNLSVRVQGTVVWKRKGSQFANIVGIAFHDIDMDVRTKMSTILSTSGDIPQESLLLHDLSSGEIDPAKAEEQSTGIIGAEKERVTPEERREEGYIYGNGLLHKDKPPVFDKDPPHRSRLAEHSEGMNAEDRVHHRAIDVDSEEQDRNEWHAASLAGHLYSLLKAVTSWHNKQRSLFIIIAIAGVLSFVLITLHNPSEKSPSMPDESIGSGIDESPYSNEPHMSDTGGRKVARNKAAFSRQLSGNSMGNNRNKYIIQVGSWKNPVFARDMLAKIKKHYPDAVIVTDNNFNKIRIPNIETSKEGRRVAEDIEDRYNLVPLLIERGE